MSFSSLADRTVRHKVASIIDFLILRLIDVCKIGNLVEWRALGGIKKGNPYVGFPFLYCLANGLEVGSLFLDSGFLTGECTQVVQFSAAYFTDFVDSNAVDGR